MANLNKVFLMGNLTRDPELRYTPNGTAVADLGLAINRKWTGPNGEKKEDTCFIDLEAWSRSAEVISEYCRKGSAIFVEGRLKLSTWEGRDGQKRSKLRVVVDNFQFVGAPSGRKGAAPGKPPAASKGNAPDEEPPIGSDEPDAGGEFHVDDDIPF